MLPGLRQLPILVLACAVVCSTSSFVFGQTSLSELEKTLQQKSDFSETDIAALERGETIVKLAPVQDKREVAVTGLAGLSANADEFLHSYRDSLTRKTSGAVMEIGTFGAAPSLGDLQDLTLEPKDIEDLKECVVGDCQIKLSAAMIERFSREINWQAPDYAQQATQLFKTMLLDYVRDYRARGDAALIQYHDKRDEVSVAGEQQALSRASSYLGDVFAAARSPHPNSELHLLEEMIVWSKIKFGLKPVIAVNHISIYKQERESGPQVLAVSKQIYANHYFNSSLALTGFVTVGGPTSYLIYENRSRADCLEGPLGNIKRNVVQNKALEALKGILQHSKMTLEAPVLSRDSAIVSANLSEGWARRLFGGIRPVLWLLVISALIALLALRNHEPVRAAPVKRLKPEQR